MAKLLTVKNSIAPVTSAVNGRKTYVDAVVVDGVVGGEDGTHHYGKARDR